MKFFRHSPSLALPVSTFIYAQASISEQILSLDLHNCPPLSLSEKVLSYTGSQNGCTIATGVTDTPEARVLSLNPPSGSDKPLVLLSKIKVDEDLSDPADRAFCSFNRATTLYNYYFKRFY